MGENGARETNAGGPITKPESWSASSMARTQFLERLTETEERDYSDCWFYVNLSELFLYLFL